MTFLIFVIFIASLCFGLIAIWLSYKEEKTKKMLADFELKYKRQFFGISILREIQDRVGYELDATKIRDVIMENLQNLLPYSVISFLLIEDSKVILTSRVAESVNRQFLDQAKIGMLAYLSSLNNKAIPSVIEENVQGIISNGSYQINIASVFHVPLIVNGGVAGMLSVFSTQPNVYTEEDMALLHQIITQASNALSKLREVLAIEQGKLLGMIGSLADGVFMIDKNNQILAMNNAAKMLLGLHKETLTLFDIVESFPQGFDFMNKIQDILIHNKSLRTSKLVLKDRTVELYVTPVTKTSRFNPAEKEVLGAAVLLHDVSIESDIEKMKDDLTSIIVHELRAPLSAIKSSSELMIKSQTSFSQEEQRKLLSIINEQAQKLLSQVSSLLDVAKLKSGRFTIDKKQEDIKAIINQSTSIFAPQAKTRQLRLITNLDETLPLVLLDKTRIGEVINNLLSNSLKFTPAGGTITVSAAKDGDKLTVSVSDTGVGIPEEKQHELFAKFSQLTPSSPSRAQPILGTGLGLYIVKGIIEAHDGYVSLNSKVNQGTTVTFTLPINHQNHTDKSQEIEKPASLTSSLTTSVH